MGFTVIVKVLVDPTQEVPPFAKVGVTTMFATIGAVVVLVAVKEIFPVPLATNPTSVLSLVQA